jgi:VanZ family protein
VYGSLGTFSPYEPGIWQPTLISIHDVAENVLVYVPFGALGVLSSLDVKRRHWLRRALKLTVLALLFSGINEALQLYTTDRVASLTDIASAAIGAFGGAAALAAWREPR